MTKMFSAKNTGGKWLLYSAKHREENHLPFLKPGTPMLIHQRTNACTDERVNERMVYYN